MNKTCQSEFGKLETVFIKQAKDAFVSDEVLEKQWQGHQFLSKPDFTGACKEYSAFEKLLKQDGCTIHNFPFSAMVSIDSIYCRDAALCTDKGVIICAMGKEARRNEPAAEEEYFRQQGIPVLGRIESPGTVEGGDVAWLDQKTLAVGYTYRTNREGIRQLKALLEPSGIQVTVVPLPHYRGPSDVFHLMSILSPVDHNLAVVYSPLMPIVFREELIRRGFGLVEVPDQEFDSMGCNVLAIAPRKCVMTDGNPITRARLEKAGCEVLTYSGNEISVKGGGGPTCLTRPLWRWA
ncbi:MAG: hypothetical protein JST46_07190 [Bacteroidetes bacterium]|nr:hypothetical protein [Bacteroidota bacterium]